MGLSQEPLSLRKVKPVPEDGPFEQSIFINQPAVLQSANMHFLLLLFAVGWGGYREWAGERPLQPKGLKWSVKKKKKKSEL